MKYTKRILSLLLSLTLVLGLLPAGVLAADESEKISVTVRFDASTVAYNLNQLYGDLKCMVDENTTNLPNEIEVTVEKGSTVQQVLQAAKAKQDFTVEGLEKGYITQVGFVSNSILGNLVSISVGDYYSYNVFNSAGWSFYINDVPLSAGISSDTVSADGAVVEGRYRLYGTWDNSTNSMVYYDDAFISAYSGLYELTQQDVDTSSFTETQLDSYTAAKNDAVDLLNKIKNSAKLNDNVTALLKESNKNFHTSDGLWIGYYESKQTTLWGPGSPTEQLQTAKDKLERAINKTAPAPEEVVVPEETTIQMGTPYQLKATVLPAEASQSVTFEKFPYLNGDCYELSDTGLITPIKATGNGKCMVTVTSVEDPTKSASFFFKITDAPAKPAVDMNTLLENIAASYTNSTDPWVILEMGAYAKAFPGKSKLSDAAKQNYINLAINQLLTKKGDYGDLDAAGYDKIILALTANGIDPAQLYPVNSNTPVSAIAGLNSVAQSPSAWSAPYTLAAYYLRGQKDCAQAQTLVNALLGNQLDDGSWSEYGTIDTTANAIAGLSFYAERADVSAAIEKGVNYLADQMKSGGVYDGGRGANANSTAMVIVGLCAAGVNPDTDDRFIKDGKSVLDGLLSYAPADHSGFGYQNNTKSDPGATEQGFRALIAASQVMSTGKAYNIYDFSANQVEPGRATGSGVVVTPSEPNTEKTITVNFTLKSDVDYWIPTTNVTVKEGSTVYHAFTSALNTAGITYEGAESGYVSSITKNGRKLAEFTNGVNSGWLYKVNGELPEVGLTSYAIHNGDNIVFYYTNDWTLEPGAWTGKEDTTPAFSDITAGSYYADAVEWAVKKGITVGTSDTTFSPDDNCTREQMAMFLWKAAGSPEPKQTGTNFTDLPGGSTAKAMLWVAEQNITSGTSDTTFSPETTCTRAQMAAFLYRYAGSPAISGTCAFADVSAEAYYHDAVLWCAHQSITAGTGGDNFSPDAPCTRGQMVTFLYRFLGNHS